MSLFILAFFCSKVDCDTILSCGRRWCVKDKAAIRLPNGNSLEIPRIAAVSSLRHHIGSTTHNHISIVYAAYSTITYTTSKLNICLSNG